MTLRCAYCHSADHPAALARCGGCGTRVHLECRATHGACPTFGCRGAACEQADRPLGPLARGLLRVGRWLLS